MSVQVTEVGAPSFDSGHLERRGITVARAVGSRIAYAVVTIWGVLTLVFLLSRVTGDPAVLMSPPAASQQQIEHTRVLLGLNRPLIDQYGTFISHAVRGDLGQSYYWRTGALGLVMQHVGATLRLAAGAALFAIVVGVTLGIVGAFRRGSVLDRLLGGGAMLGQAIPSFWLAPVLILLFSVDLHLAPSSGMAGWRSYILPIVSLGLFQLSVLYRITRAAALDAIGQDYVNLGRAKGSRPARLAVSHVLPNSLLPVITVGGLAVASLIGGSVIVENIFSWPGIGQLMIQAVDQRDFPVIEAVALVFSIGFVVINMVIDVLYGVIDPRVRSVSK